MTLFSLDVVKYENIQEVIDTIKADCVAVVVLHINMHVLNLLSQHMVNALHKHIFALMAVRLWELILSLKERGIMKQQTNNQVHPFRPSRK